MDIYFLLSQTIVSQNKNSGSLELEIKQVVHIVMDNSPFISNCCYLKAKKTGLLKFEVKQIDFLLSQATSCHLKARILVAYSFRRSRFNIIDNCHYYWYTFKAKIL